MKPVDTVVVILSAVVAIALLLTVASPLITGNQLSDEKAQLVAGLLSACVTVISIYVGSKVKGSRQ